MVSRKIAALGLVLFLAVSAAALERRETTTIAGSARTPSEVRHLVLKR